MKVYFGRNFWESDRSGRRAENSGAEQKLEKSFWYGGYEWIVPSVYRFREGFVLDICRRIPSDALSAFTEKWQEIIDSEELLMTDGQRRRIESEHPMNFQVRFEAEVNGRPAAMSGGCGTGWNPGRQEVMSGIEREILKAYDLDPKEGWWFSRCSFFWPEGETGEEIKRLRLTAAAARAKIPCECIVSASVGCEAFSVSFVHPETRRKHQIQIAECRDQAEEISHQLSGLRKNKKQPKLNFWKEYQFPEHLCALSYQVVPPLPKGEDLILQDRLKSDAPIRIAGENKSGRRRSVSAVSVIGGSHGPTSIFAAGKVEEEGERLQAAYQTAYQRAYSSLHFQPVSSAEWEVWLQKAPFPAEAFLIIP